MWILLPVLGKIDSIFPCLERTLTWDTSGLTERISPIDDSVGGDAASFVSKYVVYSAGLAMYSTNLGMLKS